MHNDATIASASCNHMLSTSSSSVFMLFLQFVFLFNRARNTRDPYFVSCWYSQRHSFFNCFLL